MPADDIEQNFISNNQVSVTLKAKVDLTSHNILLRIIRNDLQPLNRHSSLAMELTDIM